MSVSGVVVRTAPEHRESVLAALKRSGLCEVHFDDGAGKIVITVEGGGEEDAVRKMREIQNLPHVLCVDLAASYHGDD